MTDLIKLGDLAIQLTRKDVKNVHLSVHPPDGHVTLVAPTNTRLDVARAYAISKLTWIRDQQQKLTNQARETPRHFTERESHYLWGKRYLLKIVEHSAPPEVTFDHHHLILHLRQDTSRKKRAAIIHDWHKQLLHQAIPPLISKWEKRLGVTVNHYRLRRMKTKWGSCNHRAGTILINTELVKKPKHLLEYLIVHELAHLIEPTHNQRFISLLNHHYPHWQEARAELNALPLATQS